MPVPLRVTFIGSLPPHKGISPYCVSLASALAARPDIDLDVLAFRSLYPARFYPGGSPDVDGQEPATVQGARVRHGLSWWNPVGWLLAGLTLRGDIVHAQWWSYPLAPVYLAVLGLARLRGKRVVVTVHNVEPHEGGMLRRLANGLVLPLAHHFIVHSADNARALAARGIGVDRISVVPHGVPEPSPATAAERESARKHLGLDERELVALFLGNIRPYKGLEVLLRAFRETLAALPHARLIVAGQPWSSASDIESLVDALGVRSNVTLRLEFVSDADMRAYFAAADIAVYPYTRFDAQSGAACDALRFGKAIVVTRAGGLPDLVDDARAIVPAGDHHALARALVAVLGDASVREKLERDSLRIAGTLSYASAAVQTAQLYARIASREAHAPTAIPEGE
jgi:glycosyltransferase involved in cell wall biosynthesis